MISFHQSTRQVHSIKSKIMIKLMVLVFLSALAKSEHERIWNWKFGKLSKVCTLRTYKNDNILDIDCHVTKEFCIISPLSKVYYPPPVPSNFNQLKFVSDLICSMCKRRNPKFLKYDFNISSTWNLPAELEVLESEKENFLEHFKISATSLTRLQTGFHCSLKSLKIMDLSGNKFKRIEDLGFENKRNCSLSLDHLIHLNLSHNQIQKITVGLNFKRLETLYLQGNKIKEIDKKSFAKLESLKTLNLSGNSLHQLPETLFHNLSNLHELDLHDNLITKLSDSFSRDLKNVSFLDFSHNRLNEISTKALWNLTSVKKLNLHNNQLKTIKGVEFKNLEILEVIDLSENLISSIASETFMNNIHLKYLSISSNKLLDVNIWTKLKNVSIALGKNPWTCECDFIRQMVQQIEENQLTVSDGTDVYCEEDADKMKPKFLSNPLEYCEDYLEYEKDKEYSTTEDFDELDGTTIVYEYEDLKINEI